MKDVWAIGPTQLKADRPMECLGQNNHKGGVANILKLLMPKLTSKNQCSFIPGRQASDNAIIAQEIMRRKKGKGRWLAAKIDIEEKAYNRVDWDFLEKVLHAGGMEDNIIKLIMSCSRAPLFTLPFCAMYGNVEPPNSYRNRKGTLEGYPIYSWRK